MTTLGNTGLQISPVGFGAYRIREGEPHHRDALREALLSGCNLLDTSANYGDGSSERLIGQVLQELMTEDKLKRLKREDVTIVTKAGYVQGFNLVLAKDRAQSGRPFPGMVEYTPDCWHCISPEFLADQITRSLERLKLERIDVLLLHNPEYHLKAGGSAAEYYQKIEAAFTHLEKEVADGRIGYYGISSNTFPSPIDAPDATSLEVVCEIAERISPKHHFSVIQFPFNLYEPGAALEPNNARKTLTEFARQKGLGTLVNRPLNAFAGRRLRRLADFPEHRDRDVVGDFKASMTEATTLESGYKAGEVIPMREIAWGHVIRSNFAGLEDLDTWKNFLSYRLQPASSQVLEAIERHAEHKKWAQDYRSALSRLCDAMTVYLESQSSARSNRIAGLLDHLCPELQTSPTLSQKAIRLYRSLPGIDCILVGMRQTQYVRDSLSLEPTLPAERAQEALIEFGKRESSD